MNNLKEMQARLQEAEKLLSQLEKRGADKEVIEAQKKSVDKAKGKLEEIRNTPTEKAIQSAATVDFVTYNVVKDGNISKESKKMAFVKHNRPIDTKRVDKFIYLINQGKYEEAYPIIVAEAEKVLEYDYTIVDVKGEEINKEEAKEYYVILDGQHRCMAFAKLNAADVKYEIPNVYIRNKENIGEYLVEINDAAKSWDNKDKFTVAGLTSKDEVFKTIADAIQEGINPSTAAKIYIGKNIPNKTLNKVLSGEEVELPKDTKFNKERGDKFITLCKAAEMTVPLITKRYFIEGFNSYAISVGEENAFSALKKLKNLSDKQKRLNQVKEGDNFILLLREVA